MNAARKAWIVAASVGAVEALKDQGFCRWNYTIRSLHHHAKQKIKSVSQNRVIASRSEAVVRNGATKLREEKVNKCEESLRTVMFLSSWAPN